MGEVARDEAREEAIEDATMALARESAVSCGMIRFVVYLISGREEARRGR